MTYLPAATTTRHELPGVVFMALASPQKGSTANSVWRLMIAPGTPGTAHQLTKEEIIVAISGQASATINGKRHDVRAGDTLIIPALTDFSLSNEGQEFFEAMAIFPVGGQAIIGDGPAFTPPWAA